MAFSPVPTAWIPSYSSNGTTMSLPLTSYPDIKTGADHNTTGDIREIYQGMCEQMVQAYLGKASVDRPTKMSLTKSVSTDVIAGTSTLNYNFTFVCSAATSSDVVTE